MSKNKGFSDTSANRYSLALYELANESNLLDQVEENSTSILNLISNNREFKNILKDPTISSDDLLKTVNKISENFKLEKLFKNFIGFLITKEDFFMWNKFSKTLKKFAQRKEVS